MERVATKEDIIPLRDPVRLDDGQVVSELPVSPGQVCVHTALFCPSPHIIVLGRPYSNLRFAAYGLYLGRRRPIPPGAMATGRLDFKAQGVFRVVQLASV